MLLVFCGWAFCEPCDHFSKKLFFCSYRICWRLYDACFALERTQSNVYEFWIKTYPIVNRWMIYFCQLLYPVTHQFLGLKIFQHKFCHHLFRSTSQTDFFYNQIDIVKRNNQEIFTLNFVVSIISTSKHTKSNDCQNREIFSTVLFPHI